jgi:hypothetical protein
VLIPNAPRITTATDTPRRAASDFINTPAPAGNQGRYAAFLLRSFALRRTSAPTGKITGLPCTPPQSPTAWIAPQVGQTGASAYVGQSISSNPSLIRNTFSSSSLMHPGLPLATADSLAAHGCASNPSSRASQRHDNSDASFASHSRVTVVSSGTRFNSKVGILFLRYGV